MSNRLTSETVGYVIPSLGNNLNWLDQAINSIRSQDHPTEIIVVIPAQEMMLENWLNDRGINCIQEKSPNLSAAINTGVDYFHKKDLKYFAFLGDDDLVIPGSTGTLFRSMNGPNTVAAVGRCWYIDSKQNVIFHNRAWPQLLGLMTIIPNVIPHPGALMRISDWILLDGFDESLKYALDLDYWLRLKRLGKVERVECPMSLFRWHDQGLTSSNRLQSKTEAQQVRRGHAKGIFYALNIIFAPLMTLMGELLLLNKTKKR